MARPLRIEFPGAWYHVLNRGANKQRIFLANSDYLSFFNLLKDCHEMWGLEVHAYCLMPNHYHLLVHTPQGNLARCLRHLNGVYTQHFNAVHEREGSLFRGRYKAILVEKDNYLLQVARYIHLNPVKANLAKSPEDFPWSSCSFYIDMQATGKPEALQRAILLGFFGQSEEEATRSFRKFTLAGVDEETEQFYKQKKLFPILGKPAFREQIKNQCFPESSPNNEVPQAKMLLNPPSVDRMLSVIAEAYEVSRTTLTKSARRGHNEARGIAIYLSRVLGGWSLAQIAGIFGQCSYKTISNNSLKVKRKLKQDADFAKHIEELKTAICQEVEFSGKRET